MLIHIKKYTLTSEQIKTGIFHNLPEMSMKSNHQNGYKKKVLETSEFLRLRLKSPQQIGILTGTGLGEIAKTMEISGSLAYQDIPHFPVSTVESHAGQLFFGTIAEINIIAMQGRFHLYEGYSPLEVTFPIRVMQMLGVHTLIISNAAGGLNPTFNTGDIMIISDHINLTGTNPLMGPNEESWGIRFPDMAQAYDKRIGALAETAGIETKAKIQKGIYAGLNGPSLETPAEVRFLRTIGADAVGFSTVHEVISAIHAGIRVLGLSIITNIHNPDKPEPATVEKVIAVANSVAPKLDAIIRKVVIGLSSGLPGIGTYK